MLDAADRGQKVNKKGLSIKSRQILKYDVSVSEQLFLILGLNIIK